MKQNMLSLTPPMPMTQPVAVLQFKGHLRLNPDPLASIYATQGEDVAEDIVCRTLADIARRLGDLQSLHNRGAFADVVTPARRIAAIAGQIGLTEVELAALNLADAAFQDDGIACEATINRLERCFDLAMTEVWDFHALH